VSLDQLANLAEVIGNLVVVITLVYLALQIHQGTAILRSEARQAQVTTDQNGVYLFVEHPELGELFRQEAAPDFPQKTKLIFWIIAQMRVREHEWLQYKSGALDEETWISYRDVIYFVLGTKRSRSMWALCKEYFNSDFVDMVEGMLTEVPETDFWEKLENIQ